MKLLKIEWFMKNAAVLSFFTSQLLLIKYLPDNQSHFIFVLCNATAARPARFVNNLIRKRTSGYFCHNLQQKLFFLLLNH